MRSSLQISALACVGLAVMSIGCGAGRWSGAAAAQQTAQPGGATRSPQYRVDCPGEDAQPAQPCATDLVTYIGWRVYDRYCASCHAADAAGSTFAPSLLLRLRALDRRQFEAALDEGYSGRFAPLRPWGEHPQVARYYEELWAYLSARSSGDLPPVPLEPLRDQ